MRARFAWSARRIVIAGCVAAIMTMLGLSGALRPAERVLSAFSASLREHPASGQLHVVEMDAASVAAIERWPWQRGHYARVIDRLDAAGVRSIVFDVDFSSHSTPEQDRLLAQALARSRAPVTLPTFAQQASFDSDRKLDSLPIAAFRPHVALASVSVRPDADGLVRRLPLGTITGQTPRPSLAAQIAQRSGSAGESFPIDYGIDPQTLPRHSFIAIENGRFDTAALRGKDVLIGATAIEMGDRYVVPRYGVLPGVIVQALGAETLYAGVPRTGGWLLPLAMAAILSLWILGAPRRAVTVLRMTIALGLMFVVEYRSFADLDIKFAILLGLGCIVLAGMIHIGLLLREEMRERRLHDPESGLPNRRALEQAGAAGEYTVAAMIDGFDALKSVLGEGQIGQLVNRLAERLRTAGASGVIYRIDDRVLAWTTTLESYELEDMLGGLKAMMRSPLEIGGRRVDATLYYGIADAGAAAGAAHAASRALNEGLPWRYHELAGAVALEQQVSMMGELDEAIARGHLEVLYQPKLALDEDRIASVEALVRWNHPERGLLRPDSFIPMAEHNDRIADLTLYVLRRTIDDLRDWCAQDLVIKAAVNISARLVASPPFIAAAEHILTESCIPRERLIFEVTESATMDDPEAAAAALRRFRDMGIAISMDDYGTGQSSLTYLRTLPLSELKIDRSFVQFAHCDHNDALLVRSTVQLAHALGLEVVAEGVEDEACLAFLRSIECDYAQGYLIGRPMSAGQLAETARGALNRAA